MAVLGFLIYVLVLRRRATGAMSPAAAGSGEYTVPPDTARYRRPMGTGEVLTTTDVDRVDEVDEDTSERKDS
jgi:hypothetical protein